MTAGWNSISFRSLNLVQNMPCIAPGHGFTSQVSQIDIGFEIYHTQVSGRLTTRQKFI